MSNKDFKVAQGLNIQSPLPISMGGTGQTSANNVLNSLLPIQTSNSGKVLYTDGTNTSWVTLPSGYTYGPTSSRPGSPYIGQIYSNTDTGAVETYTAQGWSAVGVIPKIPTIGTASDVGTNIAYGLGSASIAFTPNNTGGTASSFTATSTSGGYSATGTSSPIVVTGIPTGTSATFTVTATNAYGNSLASTASNSVTTTSVPQAPTIGTASNVAGVANGSAAQASIVVTSNATGGKSITNYKYSTDGTTYIALSPAQTSSPLTIGGLTAGSTYAFYLKAVNANGDSIATSASNSTKVYTLTNSPTSVSASSDTSNVGQVQVSWTAPTDAGGDSISGYLITASPGGATAAASSSPYTFTGLNQGTSYTFTVQATNGAGYSVASSSSNAQNASQYYCSVGSVSGSQCVYGATAYTGYSCPVPGGYTQYSGCRDVGGVPTTVARGGPSNCCSFVQTVSGVRCIAANSNYINQCSCSYNQITCTTYTYYACPSGGTLSGTTCYITPSIV